MITIFGSRFFVFWFAHYFSRTRCGATSWRVHISRANAGSFSEIAVEISDLSYVGVSINQIGVLFLVLQLLIFSSRSLTMEWTTPQHEEIDLNCEISSYANAEL